MLNFLLYQPLHAYSLMQELEPIFKLGSDAAQVLSFSSLYILPIGVNLLFSSQSVFTRAPLILLVSGLLQLLVKLTNYGNSLKFLSDFSWTDPDNLIPFHVSVCTATKCCNFLPSYLQFLFLLSLLNTFLCSESDTFLIPYLLRFMMCLRMVRQVWMIEFYQLQIYLISGSVDLLCIESSFAL